MPNPLYWSYQKVGYDPGQRQYWSISFVSRNQGQVAVSYYFYAKSLGRDDYTYSQRRNQVTLWVGGTSIYFDYQLHGSGASTSRSGTFYVNGVANGVTSLDVQYENLRVGTNTPYYGPKSTGKHPKGSIGTLDISDNIKCTVTYDNGYNNGKIEDLPKGFTAYKGTSYTVSNNILKDSNNHYVFKKGYSLSKDHGVNTSKVAYDKGSSQTLSSDVTYYACWKPQVYNYTFYKTSKLKTEYSKLATTHTYGSDAEVLPNLNTLTKNNSTVDSQYYKVGHSFNGWASSNGNVSLPELKCKFNTNTKFYPRWSSITSKIKFNYGFGSYIREVSYTYGDEFDFSSVLKNSNDKSKSNTLLRPGYKLVGWTYDKSISDTIYQPSKAPSIAFSYNSKKSVGYKDDKFSNKQFIDNGITLYAVWEYYTTVYIYTEDGWKLALPYIYTEDGWKMSLSYCYTEDGWKL